MKKLNILLMVPVVIVLAAGTIVEKVHGHEAAATAIYGSWWFIALLALVGVAAIVAIVREKMWRLPYRLLIFGSAVLILLGGGLSTWTGSHGSMTLKSGEPNSSYEEEGGAVCQLPFTITLDEFEVVAYPGSHMPMDFVSHISVEGEKADISMNNIYKRGGYRFYQADYDEEGNTILSVAHDPVGIAVTYTGYALLVAGLLLMFLSSKSHFRKLLKGAVVAMLLLVSVSVSAAPSTLPRQTADRMGRVQVLYKGRVCPLQTMAKDFTTKLYGNATYHGMSPEQVLGGCIFYYSEWADEPIIKIKGGELRQQLGMDGRYTTLNNLLIHQELLAETKNDKNITAASEKMNLVNMVANSKLLKIYPIADSLGNIDWYSQNDHLPLSVDDDTYLFVRKHLSYCQELVVKGDFATLDTVFDKTLSYQRKQAAEVIPSPARVNAERLYNTLTTGRWLAMLIVMLGIVLFAFNLFSSPRKGDDNSLFSNFKTVIPTVIVALLTLFLLLIFVLRWIAGGHAPMAGGFDSMNLMTIALGVVTLCVVKRQPSAPSIALLAMGCCQLVAMMSGSNPPITHLMPVLSSPLLTLHVTVIMIAYALFLFVMLCSIAALLKPSLRDRMMRTNLLMLYPAVSLLAVGIIIGAVWANISWGNYWSWDPKEVWALITLIVYLYPLTINTTAVAGNGTQVSRNKTLFFHIYCALAILSVAITYFGVNLILGGIHSYA